MIVLKLEQFGFNIQTKDADRMMNSVDLDQTFHQEQSDLG